MNPLMSEKRNIWTGWLEVLGVGTQAWKCQGRYIDLMEQYPMGSLVMVPLI